jgi:carbamoyltransferase
VPLVVNTSFNDSEPIVCTPTDAIVTFRKSGIDALFMDDVYLTAKT